MLNNKLDIKTFVLAIEVSFFFCFFLSIFYNRLLINQSYKYDLPLSREKGSAQRHFYINRGYPIAWAGVSAINKNVEFPLVKAPFIVSKLSIDGSKWSKIIDLKVFIPTFMAMLVIFYRLLLPITKKINAIRHSFFLLAPIYLILLAACKFVYFSWFP